MEQAVLSTYLPGEPNRFIGRERELSDLRLALRQTRQLTLCGAGGIGKTRLALRLLTAVRQEYPDGVFMVELGDLWEPDLIVSRMASQLGIDGEAGRDLLDTLAGALGARQVLVLLDNCEHLVDACAALCQRLLAGCPGMRIVATSQEPLRIPQEAVWQVAPLAVPPPGRLPGVAELTGYEAVALFADRAAAARPGFAVTERNATAVASICRDLDGVPLAIELAAARVTVLSAEQIAVRLADRFTLLGPGDRTAPPRQRTLRATIDWSHDLLSGPEQVLLRRLSVFAGWSLEMAEQVCADRLLPAEEIIGLTAGLVDKSLVVVEPEVLGQARYRMLDSIRAYAAQRLADAGEAAAVAAPAAGLRADRVRARRGGRHGGDPGRLVGRGRRVPPLRRGQRQRAPGARPLPGHRGRGERAAALHRGPAVLDRPRPLRRGRGVVRPVPGPGPRRAAARGARRGAGRPGPADHAEPARRRAGLGPAGPGAVPLGRPADLDRDRVQRAGRGRAARGPAGRGGALRGRRAGHRAAPRATAGTRATRWAPRRRWPAAHGKLREAGQLGEAALAVMRGIDQQWGVARTLLGLGALARLRRDPAGAIECYREALPILREIDSRPDIARALAGIGRVALDQGDLAWPGST